MKIDKIVDVFNQLELQNKVKYLADLQIKADNTDVYSAIADKNFPGLKLYDTDFLIPWNRTEITEYAVFDDPKADYGRRIDRGFVPVSYLTGSDPAEDTGIVQDIQLNPLLKYAERCELNMVQLTRCRIARQLLLAEKRFKKRSWSALFVSGKMVNSSVKEK